MIKKFFPGANSAIGFYSRYDSILLKPWLKIILKGGPGVGKSTLIKKISSRMETEGREIEHHCCSSDHNSLDGAVIDRRVAIIDGTAPHTVDPIHPGVVDEILNLGDFWDRRRLMENREEIIQLGEEIGYHFKRAYVFLKEAGIIHQSLHQCFHESWEKEVAIVDSIRKDLFLEKAPSRKKPEERRLFASAITSSGVISHLHTLLHDIETIYLLKVQAPSREDYIIRALAENALTQGHRTLILHCGLHPKKRHHLILEDRKTAIITDHSLLPPTASNLEGKRIIPLSLSPKRRVSKNEWVETEEDLGRSLEKATRELREALKLHHKREERYMEAMDFQRMDQCAEKAQERVLLSLGPL